LFFIFQFLNEENNTLKSKSPIWTFLHIIISLFIALFALRTFQAYHFSKDQTEFKLGDENISFPEFVAAKAMNAMFQDFKWAASHFCEFPEEEPQGKSKENSSGRSQEKSSGRSKEESQKEKSKSKSKDKSDDKSKHKPGGKSEEKPKSESKKDQKKQKPIRCNVRSEYRRDENVSKLKEYVRTYQCKKAKKAWRKLSLKFHPDKGRSNFPGCSKEEVEIYMVKINEIYQGSFCN
jgi:hypothetical protein